MGGWVVTRICDFVESAVTPRSVKVGYQRFGGPNLHSPTCVHGMVLN
jgi:hypothetical protein